MSMSKVSRDILNGDSYPPDDLQKVAIAKEEKPQQSSFSGYPLPSYCMQIWLAGDTIHLALPSGPDGKSHVVRIPLAKCSIETYEWGQPLARQLGWVVLTDILKQRQAAREAPKIGQRSAPVQYDIDAMLRAVFPKKFDGRGVEQLDYEQLFAEETK